MQSRINIPAMKVTFACMGIALFLIFEACSDGSRPAWDVDCEPERATRPTITPPDISDQEYLVELEQWGIFNDNTRPDETTDGINEAILWAQENGFGRVRLPTGTYLLGKETIEGAYHWVDSIKMQDGTALIMDDDTTLQLITSEAPAYCIVSISGKSDVAVIGGTIRGDRQEHNYEDISGTHEESHCICVDGASDRVLIEGVTLADPGGDGVLILGEPGDGPTTDNVTISGCEIVNGRRQGISIVGGSNILIENNEIHHTGGTPPQFGIDIEGQGRHDKDILIRGNSFHHNLGGDYVNCSGTNIWVEGNDFDQSGLTEPQTDGPVIHWKETDQTIRGNTFTITVGSSNGKWGVLGYSPENARTNPAGNYFEDNVFNGGGLHMMRNAIYYITGNTVNDWMILGDDLSCLRLENNAVNNDGETYKFRNVRGIAEGNMENGEPIDLPMTDDEPFTNSPPHMW